MSDKRKLALEVRQSRASSETCANFAQVQMERAGARDAMKAPIACIARAGGRSIAQGPVTCGVDVRGFIKTDMHGCVSIDAGGVEVVGKPVPSVRRVGA